MKSVIILLDNNEKNEFCPEGAHPLMVEMHRQRENYSVI